MEDRVLIPIQSIGVIALTREAFEAALAAGAVFLPGTGGTSIDATEPLLEAAPLLGVSVRWLEDNAKAGIIPHYKMGRFLRFRMSEVAVHCRVDGASLSPVPHAPVLGRSKR
jgi:excisionase family DNA binding protein